MTTPRSLAPCLRIAAERTLPALLLLLTQCVTSYEVLGEGSGGAGGLASTGGSAGANQGGSSNGGSGSPTGGRSNVPPWTDCNDALALGANDDLCQGPFPVPCQTPLRDCCRTVASCNGGTLTVEQQCEPCPCNHDSDCGLGAWCTNGNCRPCAVPPSDACRPPFAFAPRNGCYYCILPSRCTNDAGCPTGQVCYAGQTCPASCAKDDPSCCIGNGCAAPGCGTTAPLDCSVVGCPDGMYCDVNDPNHDCVCGSNGWRCTQPPTNTCRPF